MKTWRVAVAVVVCATALFWTSGAVEAGNGVPSMEVEVVPTSGPAGTVIAVTGTCYEDGDDDCDDVAGSLLDPEGVVVDEFFTGSTDPFAGELTVPDDAVCGDYTVLVEGVENDETIIEEEVVFQVTTDCPPPTSEEPTTTEAPATEAAAETRPTFTG